MHTSIIIGAAIAVVVAGTVNSATELAVNGGFETGDFNGWSVNMNALANPLVVPGSPRTGTYAVSGLGVTFGPFRETTSIAQIIPTTVGLTYHIEFWLDGPGPSNLLILGPSSFFNAEFGGVPILSLLQSDILALPSGYAYFSGNVTALSISSLLSFSANTDELTVFAGSFRIDDVSVTALETVPQVPEPSTTAALLFLSGATGWSMWRRRSQR